MILSTQIASTHSQPHKNYFIVIFLLFGFLKSFRPGEPYLTPFLVNDKHLSLSTVNNQIYPVWDYCNWVMIPVMAFLAEIFGYRFVIFCEASGHLATRLLLLYGNTLFQMQIMQVFFAIGTASDLVYYAFVFRVFERTLHDRMTGWSRFSVLSGHFVGSLLGQACVYWLSIDCCWWLFFASSVSTALACLLTPFFPVDTRSSTNSSSPPTLSRIAALFKSLHQLFLWKNIKYYMVPLGFYAINLAYLYLVETYSASLWIEILSRSGSGNDSWAQSNRKLLNGLADCGGRGLGALGALFSLLSVERQRSVDLFRVVLVTLLFIIVFIFTLLATLMLDNFFFEYVFYIIYVGASSTLSAVISAWLGTSLSKVPSSSGISDKYSLLFALATFLSSSFKSTIQFSIGFFSPTMGIVGRFWVFVGVAAFLVISSSCYLFYTALRYNSNALEVHAETEKHDEMNDPLLGSQHETKA